MNAPEEQHIIRQEGKISIGDFTFDVVHTPGHSPGSISFIFKEDGFAIVGDTLFEQRELRHTRLKSAKEKKKTC